MNRTSSKIKRRVLATFAVISMAIATNSSVLAGPLAITPQQLDALKSERKEPKVSEWFYMGEKQGHHFFYHHDLGNDLVYSVPVTQLQVQPSRPFSKSLLFNKNRNTWISLNWDVMALSGHAGERQPSRIDCSEQRFKEPKCILILEKITSH
jgi:hypothetical protein